MFWGDSPEERAKASLRSALHNLRSLTQDHLTITRHTIGFDRTSAHWLDVDEFTQRVEPTLGLPDGPLGGTQRNGGLSKEQAEALREASELYQGEFMAGFQLRDIRYFEEWVLSKREPLRNLALHSLQRLVMHHTERGEYQLGIEAATRLLVLDPALEEGHRAKMRLLALSGQRSAALAQYKVCEQLLTESYGLEPSADTRALFGQIEAGNLVERDTMAPAAPIPGRKGNLPAPVTPLVGREDELEHLRVVVSDPSYRLVTLVGVGGVGKTRLALAAAEELGSGFDSGAWIVRLTGVGAPLPEAEVTELGASASSDSVILAIAETLELTISGQRLPQEHLIDYLRDREMLLVLDDVEHLVASGGEGAGAAGLLTLVLDILQSAPGVTLLVTSRQRLGLRAEYMLRLTGLPVPQVGDAEGERYSSVQLFAERAGRALGGFELNDDNLLSVVQICLAVEGLPLGIELAASWTDRMELPDIVGALERDLDLLVTTMRDVPERQRSMRAVFAHSWRLLSEEEQRNLAQLTVFQGGFSERAARAVVDASMDDLGVLVDKSLLRRVEPGRYSWHTLLQQFAAEEVGDEEGGGLEGVRQRHSLFYLDLVTRRGPGLKGGQPQAVSSEIQREWENIKQAWHWAVAAGDVEHLGRSLEALSRFTMLKGLVQQAKYMFGTAAEAVVSLEHSEADLLQACLLIEVARCLTRQAHYRQAIAVVQHVLEIARTRGAPELEAQALLRWGVALLGRGEYASARERLDQALLLGGESKAEGTVASCLSHLGLAAIRQGDYGVAQEYLDRALGMHRGRGDVLSEAGVLSDLGLLRSLEGHYASACANLERALAIFRRVGDRRGESVVYQRLGAFRHALGDYGGAREQYERALRISRDIGERSGEAEALVSIGLLLHDQGRDDVASAIGQQAVDLTLSLGARAVRGRALTSLGRALTAQGLAHEALVMYERAVKLQREIGWLAQSSAPLAGMAEIELRQGELERARRYVDEILSLGETYSLVGVDQALWVQLVCYRVLAALEDRRAEDVLASARSALEERSARISDEEVRKSFLENVAAHRELAAIWGAGTSSGV
jgi:predicted ATPase/DNA-binding SARP family transcriptional activator